MRLSTLARKIDKTPNQLISILEKKEIAITNGLHSKLDSDTVDFILKQYLPEQQIPDPIIKSIVEVKSLNDENPKEDDESSQAKDELQDEVKNDKTEDEKPAAPIVIKNVEIEEKVVIDPISTEIPEQNPEPKTGTLDDLENENAEKIELIKAKKVKLDGIKVIGKIDLPEKQKKETDTIDNAESPPVKAEKSNSSKSPQKPIKKAVNKRLSSNRKSIGYEEKTKREERYKQKLIKQKSLEEKKRKIEYYKNNIQPKATPKVKKKNKTSNAVVEEQVVVAKNPIKRLWEWLNGKYDKY